MLHTDLEDIQCYPDLGVSWCINAKNSLHCVRGFSPYQLAIGKNLKMLLTLNQKVPALTCQFLSKIVSSNLDAIHRARKFFIASKNSEKIRRSLPHNIRSNDFKLQHSVISNISQETLSTIRMYSSTDIADVIVMRPSDFNKSSIIYF